MHAAYLPTYAVRMGGPTRKSRLNLTIDPDIYRESRRLFNVLDLNMSGFIETQLAAFLQLTRPLLPLLDAVEDGSADPAEVKLAMRAFMANSQEILGGQLQEFGKATGELSEFVRELEAHTDKK